MLVVVLVVVVVVVASMLGFGVLGLQPPIPSFQSGVCYLPKRVRYWIASCGLFRSDCELLRMIKLSCFLIRSIGLPFQAVVPAQ